jgi:hypothetical protein
MRLVSSFGKSRRRVTLKTFNIKNSIQYPIKAIALPNPGAASFNEFYPKRSGPAIPSLHTILPPDTSDRILLIIGIYSRIAGGMLSNTRQQAAYLLMT